MRAARFIAIAMLSVALTSCAARRPTTTEPSVDPVPTSALDSTNGEAVMELLRELHRGGATICMVTHDPRYARHADRSIHIFDGRVVDEMAGSPT